MPNLETVIESYEAHVQKQQARIQELEAERERALASGKE